MAQRSAQQPRHGVRIGSSAPLYFRRGPEGDIWTFLGNTLVRIDPRTAHVMVVGQLPARQRPAQIAFAQGNVYIAWGGFLRQIKDLHTGQVQTAGNTTDKGPRP